MRIALATLELIAEWLKHHLVVSLAGIAAVALIALWIVTRSDDACVSMPDTPLGPLNICRPSKAPPDNSAQADGLHGDVYVDRRAGFSLRLPNAEQWSVVQPHTNPDGTYTVEFPPGILGRIPVAMMVRDVSVVFVNKAGALRGASSAWVFRVPRRYDQVEKFIAEEGKDLLRTGAVVATYTVGEALGAAQPAPTSPRDAQDATRAANDKRVRLTNVQVSPNQRDALLLWERPQEGVPIDLIGRVVAAERDTYYLVTLKFRDQGPAQNDVNAALRMVLTSFAPL